MIKGTVKEIAKKYFESRGGRKTANARVRVYAGKGSLTVNGKPYDAYFKTEKQRLTARSPIDLLKMADEITASAIVRGGGVNAQADAVRNGLSRALIVFNPELRKRLRRAGFVTRDARVVERKKYGLKKARRAPQWNKR